MSREANEKYLWCDGEGCQARTLAPVALHSFFPVDPHTLSTRGWLFVHEDGRTSHFCPCCAQHYLNELSRGEYHSVAGG